METTNLDYFKYKTDEYRYMVAFLLRTHNLFSEDGFYTFPNGETWDILEADAILEDK